MRKGNATRTYRTARQTPILENVKVFLLSLKVPKGYDIGKHHRDCLHLLRDFMKKPTCTTWKLWLDAWSHGLDEYDAFEPDAYDSDGVAIKAFANTRFQDLSDIMPPSFRRDLARARNDVVVSNSKVSFDKLYYDCAPQEGIGNIEPYANERDIFKGISVEPLHALAEPYLHFNNAKALVTFLLCLTQLTDPPERRPPKKRTLEEEEEEEKETLEKEETA